MATKNLAIFDNVKFVNRLSYLIAVIAILVLIISVIIYTVQNRFRIDKIVIKGDVPHITSEQLSYIAKNKLHGTFFTLDIDQLQSEFNKIPWVKSVVVTRDFPDNITVYVNEYKAIARFGDENLIAPDGRVFSGADDSTSLPIFNGQVIRISEFLTDYKLLEPFLTKESLSLTEFDVTNTEVNKIYLSNGLTVVTCGQDISSDIDKLQLYFDKVMQLNPGVNYINMCYHNAFAIKGGSIKLVESRVIESRAIESKLIESR